jgi:hypothetical protein
MEAIHFSFPCIAAGERTYSPVSPALLLSDKRKRALCEMSRNGGPKKQIRAVDRSFQEDTSTTSFQRSPMRFSAGQRQKCALRIASPKTIARIISIDWACPGALRIP